ncbi:MAG: hypothetical protein GTN89_12575 [Acidobacteria bacterium]|nr:hypothetical protein [Acidobacteriota bacterium]NIM63717.1 hypothetical protein [Acidobacteriota bacterium]NIO60102.1 hypothetical protein [Acidobacteriota bacterium]NIQ31173.1 hypothetical protein [Acidobacteriota bacterium]NIQ86302.1 hypothetical protein [Acidobacteriota bacterium]
MSQPSDYLTLKLWLIVLLELISPIPVFLTIGAIVVLLTRPPWFRQMVDELYSR